MVNSMINFIYSLFLSIDLKDRITIIVGIVALSISLASFTISLISYKQRSKEGLLSVRKQLSDTMQKLLDLNTEGAKRDLEPEKYPKNYGGLIGDQRRFHARLAHTLIVRLKFEVSRWELLLLGRAFADLTDYDLAEKMFLRAIQSHTSPVEDATVARSYARFLFMSGEAERARDKLTRALGVLATVKIVPFEEGFTYEQWAGFEWYFGDRSKVLTFLNMAIDKYQCDVWQHRRDRSIERLKESEIYKDACLADEDL